ncbi:MOSC domain-containing protein [Nocardioides sp. NPDC051685]|uniref:MOSC domain-containing protein n=1 Tax=Nocardioides sp. NPDC051685 TaxID=3364334 RepID=UPI0037ACF57E
MRLAGINLHPVKSTAIRPVEEAYVGRAGIVGDREWMVVDGSGTLVTARELRELFTIVADTPSTGGPAGVDLLLNGPEMDPLEVTVPGPEAPAVGVRLFQKPLTAKAVGEPADAWLRKALGRDDLRLVWCADPTKRAMNPAKYRPGEFAAFHDSSPVSLISDASAEQIDAWAEGDVPAGRFRANLLVEGAPEAFAEDGWSEVAIGGARFRVAAPIDRCVMTTIDADTLESGKDPLRALAKHRRWDGKVWAAVHLAVAHPGEIAVGDEVIVS